MRWSPYIEGQWIARVPADQAWNITGADKMKWNEMDDVSVEKGWNEIYGRGKKGETSSKTHPDQVSSTTKPTWNVRDGNSEHQRSGERRASKHLRYEAARKIVTTT